jgi:hypothetical protein
MLTFLSKRVHERQPRVNENGDSTVVDTMRGQMWFFYASGDFASAARAPRFVG